MRRSAVARLASLALILELSLGVRLAAANLVQSYVEQRSVLAAELADRPICIFPDTRFYWDLARTIREGTPYEIMYYGDIPHFALRTPGYPLFLAACQSLFGELAFPIRLIQALLGTLSVWLVFQLTREVVKFSPDRLETNTIPSVIGKGSGNTPTWTVPLGAACIAGLEPYTVSLSPLILSEAVFVPLLLASLWGMATIWRQSSGKRGWRASVIALGVGSSLASAVLVRPSCSLFIPLMLGVWTMSALRINRLVTRVTVTQASRELPSLPSSDLARRLRLSGFVALGFVVLMSPWWIRNGWVYGRFVPTALWSGASLYDGLNPRATGGSDMSFLGDPDIWPLGEEDQDDELARRALAFVRESPGHAAWLAVAKFGRYWRPWPDASGFRSTVLALVSAAVTLPLFALIAIGAWSCRRDLRVWVLLAGPVLYFCVLHMAFASSMRYRIPAEVPALGLAAIGLGRIATRFELTGA